MPSVLRIARAGLVAALVVGFAGWTMERVRFGATDQAALARLKDDLRDRLDAAAGVLSGIASRIVVEPVLLRNAARDQSAARTLFELTSSALRDQQPGRTGVSIYDASGNPVAWAGRVFDLPKERLTGPAAWLVAPGVLGPRLIYIQPIDAPAAFGRGAVRSGAIVVEYALTTAEGTPEAGDFLLTTSIVPVRLRASVAGAPAPARTSAFLVSSRDGAFTAEADVSPADITAARARWQSATWASVIAVLGVTLLLCAPVIVERRRRTRTPEGFLGETAILSGVGVGTLALLLFAARNLIGGAIVASPTGLLLMALAAVGLVALLLDLVERRRIANPRPALPGPNLAMPIAVRHIGAGLAAAAILAGYEVLLHRIVANTVLDVVHFSLHPIEAPRLSIAFALLLLHASAVWGAVAATRAASTFFRAPRAFAARAAATAGWTIGAGVIVAVAGSLWGVPVVPLIVVIGASAGCAIVLARVERGFRRASQAARLFIFFLALLAPALAIYPSLVAYATDTKERLVANVYGPEVASQREDLQHRLQRAIDQIDSIPALSDYLDESDTTSAADRAFVVWSRTDLATFRLTSSVELYGAEGGLVSRFALHLPEYEYPSGRSRATSCAWEDLFDEVSPFGSTERHVLRTSRGICEHGRILGTVVVRVMLDYRTLPFISTQSPYLASLDPNRRTQTEAVSGHDVEFAMYGWTRAPIIESGSTVWSLPDPVFDRLVTAREPFWTLLPREGALFRVYLQSDRGAIYALGYPIITGFGHLINLAELALLTMVAYALLLTAATIGGALTAGAPASGRALLREVRSSFYRKLFLAFIAATVIPVVILAFAIRTYFANELTAGGVDAAQRTVTTAQRLVEDYAAIQQSGPTALSTLDDQIMVLVWRAIDEDVNVFDRTHLQATSARDLFASQLLSARTPGDVYKSILLDRAPTSVGDEQIGSNPYRLAAAPVRAGGRDGIVTVPLTNRREEIEQQIDELDRRVRSAAVLFIVLGAATGYWMAERIADPVNRLTRATRRIARGELSVRIAATSSDELRRLVQDFNQMAADLQRQRTELERTQRLEAWADMARQVAHDIKNPLTPIQLAAEHARRVNLDRGQPLSPVLDECVTTILSQVRLLRQISAEFSSFASSPTPRPEPSDVGALIEEVVDPYRLGLSGRVEISVSSPAAPVIASLDRTLFARALTNVIENALHAMPGGGALTIATRTNHTSAGERELIVEITDTGIGMDAAALARIFEPYFSTKATGTGLGLTIAKRNVELNGGRIDVRSQRGVGTTVEWRFPLT